MFLCFIWHCFVVLNIPFLFTVLSVLIYYALVLSQIDPEVLSGCQIFALSQLCEISRLISYHSFQPLLSRQNNRSPSIYIVYLDKIIVHCIGCNRKKVSRNTQTILKKSQSLANPKVGSGLVRRFGSKGSVLLLSYYLVRL